MEGDKVEACAVYRREWCEVKRAKRKMSNGLGAFWDICLNSGGGGRGVHIRALCGFKIHLRRIVYSDGAVTEKEASMV